MPAVLSEIGQTVYAGRPGAADSDLSQRAPTGPGASGQNQTDGTLGWARGPLEDGEPTIAGVVVNDAFAPKPVITRTTAVGRRGRCQISPVIRAETLSACAGTGGSP